MTLKQLGLPDLATLETWTEADIRKHFDKYLEICRPKVKLEAKPTKRAAKATTSKGTDDDQVLKMLQAEASKAGFGDLKLKELMR